MPSGGGLKCLSKRWILRFFLQLPGANKVFVSFWLLPPASVYPRFVPLLPRGFCRLFSRQSPSHLVRHPEQHPGRALSELAQPAAGSGGLEPACFM